MGCQGWVGLRYDKLDPWPCLGAQRTCSDAHIPFLYIYADNIQQVRAISCSWLDLPVNRR